MSVAYSMDADHHMRANCGILVPRVPRQDVVVLSHNHYVARSWLHIRRAVQNTGATAADIVKVVVTMCDAAGQDIGTDSTYTDLDTVPAGGTSPFETGTDHWHGFDHYDIQVQAEQ